MNGLTTMRRPAAWLSLQMERAQPLLGNDICHQESSHVAEYVCDDGLFDLGSDAFHVNGKSALYPYNGAAQLALGKRECEADRFPDEDHNRDV